MNTRWVTARKIEEENVNEGVPPQGPQGDQVPRGNQVLVDPPAMSNEEVRSALLMMAQAVTTQAQAMMAQANRGVETHVNYIVSTMASSNRLIGVGPIDWEVLKKVFFDRFFPHEKREAKVEEFINHRQGSMNVHEYSLKFTLLSMYAPSLVSNPRDEMSRYVMGVSDLVEEECHTTMLHDDMNISKLMVYAQSIEESKLKRKNRKMKRVRSDE
ncbi:hypothetical protein R3W88_031871 [Solanum pinnatisectum]|uniref:Retrotransposon gag domain-containing protein n=1 Tax=Solanum pinnatisectum TaxID=50273 RepID=A0AAV9LMK0_9SOLN|nr:hypothetical protein R3W88_031871 [Solanum pinnatisectum]